MLIDSSTELFWKSAARDGLPRFRLFRRPLTAQEVEANLSQSLADEWEGLKQKLQPYDQIWTFDFREPSTLRHRCRGYIVMRRGQPIGGIITQINSSQS